VSARPPILALKGVRLADGPRMLFDDVDLALDVGARACLVGRNGVGKSTLLRMLAGAVEPDDGDRSLAPAAKIALVAQEPQITGASLLDYAIASGAKPHDAEANLQAFGLDPRAATTDLSGGEQRRAALARAFAEQPDVLLLDEPTNHLDIFAIETLEAMLRQSRAACLIVSHDRAFLRGVTRQCFWLEARRVWRLDKGFAAFDRWAEKIAADQDEALRRLGKSIERETYWFHRSITAQRTRNEGRARQLADMRRRKAELMRDQTRGLSLAIDSGPASGRRVIEAHGIAKAFGDRVLIKGFSTRILRGERVAVVGPNGAGKTTLVKILLGETAPDAGSVKLGANLAVTYLDQTRAALKPEATLWETLAPGGGDQVIVRGVPRHIGGYARDFLFQDSQLRQPVATLSGGERNRLLLARALAQPTNLLVLDEPTNDLDMETLDLLEDMLAGYDGTLVLISHDRDFIDRLATSTIALDGRGRVVETPGGWSDFVSQNPDFFETPKPAERSSAPAPKPARTGVQAKLSYKDQHRLEQLDGLMPKLTAEIARLEGVLADADLYARDPVAFQAAMTALDTTRTHLAAAEDEWLTLEEKREALASG
jgi:ATP-binding cassette subfamily F protein uup